MYKILLVGMSHNIGGIETYLYNLVKNADRNKFEFCFLYPNKDKMAFEDEMISMGIKIYKLTNRRVNRRKHKNEIREVYENEKFDCIHYSIMSYSWYEPIVQAKKSNIKLILHSHNAGPFDGVSIKTKLLNYIGMKKIRNANYYQVACGIEAGQFLFKNDNFEVFDNGIDIDRYRFSKTNRETIRKELSIDNDTYIVGSVAKLEAQKNPLFLIDIFYEYQKKNEKSALIMIGEGSLENDIKRKIDEYKIKDKVLLLGKRMDANKIYSAMDVFIMPSLFEGLSISLVEAQVNGLMCLVSNNIDKDCNISGNVRFVDLKNGSNAEEWSKVALENSKIRDKDVLEKISSKYNSNECFKKVYNYYENIITGGESNE
ncbi:MAG: glycosyltransferase [Clostridia bacterium]|nr:glycosyltransferase [Clostridia bacterium]